MPAKSKPKPSGDLSFEAAMEELEGIVQNLEGENLTLDDLVRQSERGFQLWGICQKRLTEAEKRIQVITGENESGEKALEEFPAKGEKDATNLESDEQRQDEVSLFE
jgi:exodeoxyribonuclease VII small subunit